MLKFPSHFASWIFTCVAFAIVAGNPWWLLAQGPADDDLVSNAVGLRSIQRLVGSKALQEELEISPVQFAELKKCLASEEVKTAPKRDFTQQLLLESLPDVQVEDFGKIVSMEDSVDGLVERKASTILHPEQAAELRIRYLRGRMSSPSVALEPSNIAALGLLKNQNDQISSRWVEPMKEIETKCTRVRTRSIATC